MAPITANNTSTALLKSAPVQVKKSLALLEREPTKKEARQANAFTIELIDGSRHVVDGNAIAKASEWTALVVGASILLYLGQRAVRHAIKGTAAKEERMLGHVFQKPLEFLKDIWKHPLAAAGGLAGGAALGAAAAGVAIMLAGDMVVPLVGIQPLILMAEAAIFAGAAGGAVHEAAGAEKRKTELG